MNEMVLKMIMVGLMTWAAGLAVGYRLGWTGFRQRIDLYMQGRMDQRTGDREHGLLRGGV